ncbi:sterile alpha motif domain-containing protein 9-like, partial [Scomber scombrus]
SLCEEFLGLQPKPVCGTAKVEEGFGKFSTLISSSSVESKVVHKAVKMIHSSIARQCLQELTTTHNVSKADITDLLLTTDKLYESTQGKHKLLQDVHHIMVKRIYSVEDSKFSPLIQEIASETPGQEEMILLSASKRFDKDAVISQLVARYYYLKKKNFTEAKLWARSARDLSKDSSYMADTSAQVIKHELKNAIANCKEEPMPHEKLNMFLKVAQSAIDAFKETQSLAKKESSLRLQTKRDNCPFNTAGCLGEIQVGVLVIDLLQKTPVFSSENVRHDILSKVLSGDIKLQDVERCDQRQHKHRSYYIILRHFEDLLYSLKIRMKTNFDFLEEFHVNLGSGSGMKDSREQVVQNELFRGFKQYANLFCKTDSASLLKNKTMWNMVKENCPVYTSLWNYISQMRTSYHATMKEVYNGKRPIVHFFLGKKWGYERLVHLREIKRCSMVEEGQFVSMWEDGSLWEDKKVQQLLRRVTGEVKGKFILTATCEPGLKLKVIPMFQSQLSGTTERSKVSFFIGFSMKGPVALDIN